MTTAHEEASIDLNIVAEKAVLAALKHIQELGGYEWVDLAPSDKVIGCVEGFDSLTSIETTVLVEQKLATTLGRTGISLGKNSIFVSDDGKRALAFRQVVKKVCAALERAK